LTFALTDSNHNASLDKKVIPDIFYLCPVKQLY